MLLAKEVAHTTDVDGMLAQMTPQQWNEWVVIYKIWNPTDEGEPAKGNIGSALDTMRKMTGV